MSSVEATPSQDAKPHVRQYKPATLDDDKKKKPPHYDVIEGDAF